MFSHTVFGLKMSQLYVFELCCSDCVPTFFLYMFCIYVIVKKSLWQHINALLCLLVHNLCFLSLN